jgi:starch synthase
VPEPLRNFRHEKPDISIISTAPDFSQDTRDRLSNITDDLQDIFSGLSVTDNEIIHTTLFVLGERYGITPEMADKVKAILNEIGPLKIRVKGISMGANGNIFAQCYVEDEKFYRLIRRLEWAFPDETRPSRLLHVSLARISEQISPDKFKQLYDYVAAHHDIDFGQIEIKTPQLIEVMDRWGFEIGRNYVFFVEDSAEDSIATGLKLKDEYVDKLEELKQQGKITPIEDPADELNVQMSQDQQNAYMREIKNVLSEQGKNEITPEILFEAARRATVNDKSTAQARVCLQPGTMNPLHYGHITASLAGIITQVNETDKDKKVLTLLANGGTVPEKFYAASADIRNEMAREALKDRGLDEWLEVTPIRGQLADMFRADSGTLKLAGEDDTAQRFNMDIAAFVWLIVANPNVEWVYIVGSDKVGAKGDYPGYGRKEEIRLVQDTLAKSGVKILYFERKGQEIDYDFKIKPYFWLNDLWQKGVFEKSELTSFADLSATDIRMALIRNDQTVNGLPVDSLVPASVIDYIKADNEIGRTLRFLYELENKEKIADGLVKDGILQRGLAAYQVALDFIIENQQKNNISADMLRKLNGRISKKIAQLKKNIKIQDHNSRMIESGLFIKDLNDLAQKYLDQPKISRYQYDTARAMAYEINRRLSSRDGIRQFSRFEKPDLKPGDTDKEYERYNRVLEGVIQVLTRDQYPNVFVNKWGYDKVTAEENINNVCEQFSRLFFVNIVKGMQKVLARTGYIANAPPAAMVIIDKVRALTEKDLNKMSADEIADDIIRPLIATEKGLAIFDDMQEKFMLYSGAPGTGKGAVMDRTFDPKSEIAKYKDIIDKLTLYHTRDPRNENQPNKEAEKDGIKYHFRTEQQLRELESQGKIETAWVNKQLQGLADENFIEQVTMDKAHVGKPNRREEKLDSDVIVSETDTTITVTRKIQGSQAIFDGRKPVILEGGFGWYLALKERYPNITTAFISSFEDSEIVLRSNNTRWINETFTHSDEKRLAYEELAYIVSQNKGEVDITVDADLQKQIIHAVYKELNVVFVTPEVLPFSKAGGLAEVLGQLPRAILKEGHNPAVFTPRFKNIDTNELEYIDRYDLNIGGEILPTTIWKKVHDGVEVYFIDNMYTNTLYGDDDLKVALTLSEGVLQIIDRMVKANIIKTPNVINANDWTTGLLPLLLKTKYSEHPIFKDVVSAFSIHNLAYQGGQGNRFPGSRFNELGIGGEHWDGINNPGDPDGFNLVKAGIFHADKIITVSEKYAQEIKTDEFGERMQEVLKAREDDLEGVLNGMEIPKAQILDSHQKKAVKRILQREFGLVENDDAILIGMATRVTQEKNLDGALRVIERLLNENKDLQFVFKGEGHPDNEYTYEMHSKMVDLAQKFPGRFGFEDTPEVRKKHSHILIAGCDILLVPSRKEPCGLVQQVGLLQGALVVVHAVGGLSDTVREFNPKTGQGNGFRFDTIGDTNDQDFYDAVQRAISVYKDEDLRAKVMLNAQTEDRSWAKAARRYAEIYTEAFLDKKKANIEAGITEAEAELSEEETRPKTLQDDTMKPFAPVTAVSKEDIELRDQILESLSTDRMHDIIEPIERSVQFERAI